MSRVSHYNAIIVGAGHNGLVTACYLARAGWRVLILERRHILGGACVSEETFPGFRVSTAAYVNSLFRQDIIRDFGLEKYGFQVLEREPSSFTPFPDGRHLLLGADHRLNHEEISKFSTRDANNYSAYEDMLDRIKRVVDPILTMTPPDIRKPGLRDLWNLFHLGRDFLKLGRYRSDAIELFTCPARTILDRWFESEQLKGTLATDAVIGTMASPSTPGTAYILLHHLMGETKGRRGMWGYVRGGMGGLTQALAAAARDLKVDIRCSAEVNHILIQDRTVSGVTLDDGDEFYAPVVASNADAHITFRRLVDPKHLPKDFLEAVDRISYESASLKINVALSELPNFLAHPDASSRGRHLRGTIHICPDLDYIEHAFDDAKYGRPSTYPILECTIPSVVDPTVAPPGKHLMSLFVQYAPYKLNGATWDELRESVADRCFDILNEYAPNFRAAVLSRQILTPLDLERTFNLTGGNIFQGAMTLNQLFCFRPLLGYANYRTPIAGLYLCGSAAHPGGGVMGTPGANAAREILRDNRARPGSGLM